MEQVTNYTDSSYTVDVIY